MKEVEKIIKSHQLKELVETDPYKKGWHRGYWEGIRDCLEIECKDRNTPEWLSRALNNYNPVKEIDNIIQTVFPDNNKPVEG